MASWMELVLALRQRPLVVVAGGNEFEIVGMCCDRTEMASGNASATDDADADPSILDDLVHGRLARD